jgi:hypothetical protein
MKATLAAISALGSTSDHVLMRRQMQAIRRLEGIPSACAEACPTAESVLGPFMGEDVLDGLEAAGIEDVVNSMATLQGNLMDSVCQHGDVFACLVENADVCEDESDDDFGDDDGGSIAELTLMSDCLCDACPGTARVYGELEGGLTGFFVGAMMGFGEDLDEDGQMDLFLPFFCPAVGANECFMNNPGKCALILESDSDDAYDDDDDVDFTEVAPMCTDAGIATTYEVEDYNDDDSSGKVHHVAFATTAFAAMAGLGAAFAF